MQRADEISGSSALGIVSDVDHNELPSGTSRPSDVDECLFDHPRTVN